MVGGRCFGFGDFSVMMMMIRKQINGEKYFYVNFNFF